MKKILNLFVILLCVGVLGAQTTAQTPATNPPLYLYQDSITYLKRQLEEQKKLVDAAEKIKIENQKLKSDAEQAKANEAKAKAEADQTKATATKQIEQNETLLEKAKSDVKTAKSEVVKAKADADHAKEIADQAKTDAEKAKEQSDVQIQKVQAELLNVKTQVETSQLQAIAPQITDNHSDVSEKACAKTQRDTLKLGNSSITISGNSVIIGNNNRIVIVDDKSKIQHAQRLLDDKEVIENRSETQITDEDLAPIKIVDETEYAPLKPIYKAGFFDHFSFSIGASTLGFGAEIATTISSRFRLRLGVDYFDFKLGDIQVPIDNTDLNNAVGYNPDYKFDLAPQMLNTHALIDWQPFRNGIFYITAGVYYGENKASIDGQLLNPTDGSAAQLLPTKTWPMLNLNGYKVKVQDGRIDGEAVLGNLVKPYFGIGLGRSVPRKRVGVLFELGALYQGDITLKQNNVKLEQDANESIQILNGVQVMNFYPVAKLNLVVRLN